MIKIKFKKKIPKPTRSTSVQLLDKTHPQKKNKIDPITYINNKNK